MIALVVALVAGVGTVMTTVPVDPSPAGCRIEYVTDPHPSDSVPGAVKVNVKSQCNRKVQELDLAVTLLADGKPVAKTLVKAENKAYLMNQDTYIMCKNFEDSHNFQGTAMGTSFEDDKPYIQIKPGREVSLPCGL